MNPDQATEAARPSASRDFVWIGMLGVVFAVSLLSMPAVRYDGDVMAWEMEAESLVYRGTLAVRTSVAESLPARAPYFVFNPTTGRWHSKYGIGNTGMYAIPLALERIAFPRPPDPPGDIFGKPNGPFEITRRVELFNGFNLLLTLLLATVLYRLGRQLSHRRMSAAAFALSCLYATYLWNYTRAQSSQIYQVLFFSLAFGFLLRAAAQTRASHRPNPHTVFGCVLSLSALCSVKLVFLPLIPVFALGVVYGGWDGRSNPLSHAYTNLRENLDTYVRWGVVPLVLLAAVLLWVNDLKFGSPWNMGYERETNLFGGHLAESVPAYLISPRFSIFVHFPMLVVAAFGVPFYWRHHRFALASAVSSFAVMFFLYASYTYWKGEASYGPRYLLFGSPVLALPALAVFDAACTTPRTWARRLAGLAIAALLLGSIAAQILVNRLEFHTFFRLRQQFQAFDRQDPELRDYWRNTHTATFNRQFIRFRDDGTLPFPLRRVKPTISAERYRNLEDAVRAHLSGNHYFW